MMPLKMPYCIIEKSMRDNYLTLFEELRDAMNNGTLEYWYKDNEFLIGQSISELETLDVEFI